MKPHRILVGLGIVLIAVVTTTTAKAQAKLQPTVGRYKESKTVLFVNSPDVFRIAKRLGLKVHMVKLSKSELEKLAKLPATGCSCAPSDEQGGGCFTSCLRDYGISDAVILECAVACAISPVSCGICLGVSSWVVLGCALSCNPPWLSSNKPASPLRHNVRHSTAGSQQAKLLLRQPRVALR